MNALVLDGWKVTYVEATGEVEFAQESPGSAGRQSSPNRALVIYLAGVDLPSDSKPAIY